MILCKSLEYKITYDEKLSTNMYILKAIAIFFVICAHCINGINLTVDQFLKFFGTLGVPIFFVLSGYSFDPFDKKKQFWLKKIKMIIVPWLVWGVVTYFTNIVSNHGVITFGSIVKWILGNGTWLYFVPVLLICFFVFMISKKLWYVIGLMILSLISITLSFAGVIQLQYITNYLNPINWFFFFGGGILVKSFHFLKILRRNHILKAGIIAGTIAISIYYFITNNITYFSPMAVLVESLWSLCLLCLNLSGSRILEEIGKNTYFIYFFHMQFGLFFVKFLIAKTISLVIVTHILTVASPLLCLAICCLSIIIIKQFAELIGAYRLLFVIGIKE